MVYRCDKRAFYTRLLLVAAQSILPLVNLWVLKELIDSVTNLCVGAETGASLPPQITQYVMVFCLVFLANRIVSTINGVNNDVMTQKLIDYMSDKIQHQSALLDMDFYDNPDFHDTFHRAQQESTFRPIQVLNNFMALFGSLISIASIVVILTVASWWVVVVMFVAVLPSFAVRLIKARKIYKFRRENTQSYRRTSYYSSVLTHRDFAKELRVFGLSPYFRSKFVDIRRRLVDKLLRISRRLACYDLFCSIVEALSILLILGLLLREAFAGAISIGLFVMLFEAFRRGQGYMQTLVSSVASLYDNRLFASNLFEFFNLKPKIISPKHPIPFPQLVESVVFDDVSFRYSNMDHDVLHHFNLTARVGETCRIEGENGFGKSTALKLLMRLHDPDKGSIKINGIDIRNFAVDDLRRSIAPLFQDFVRYQCTANDNIAFGDIRSALDQSRIEQAAFLSGADKVVEKLPHSYDTQLGRMFDGGEELSMGQWQRVALARLFYSDAPILLLDEPTAWIDIPSRESFFNKINEINKHKIIIIIQHI